MKVIVHIISSDSWSGRQLEGIKTYKTVRAAKAFVKRFNAQNNLPQTPAYYEFARIHSIDGAEVMSTIKIYGASDDLVEIGGDLSEEFNVSGPTYLLFNDGTQVKVEYGDDGVWGVGPVRTGEAQWDKALGLPDGSPERQCHGDPDAPSYSDVVTLTWDKPFKLVKRGSRKLSPPPPEDKGALELANKVIAHIEKTRGGEFFLHEIDEDGGNDGYNDFKDGLIRLLANKPCANFPHLAHR